MRHKHNLGFYQLLTGDLGQLLPCGLVEVLPGDVFNHSASAMVRLSPMVAPVMHQMRVRLHHFFVPHRLTWPPTHAQKWEEWITGGDGTAHDPAPTISTTANAGDLQDYLGVPRVANLTISALPIRAYNLIFNEWFRDQDLVSERGLTSQSIATVAWERDYLTTARPWPQKGDEVTLPLGSEAPVRGIGVTSSQGAAAGFNLRTRGGQTDAVTGWTGTDAAPGSGQALIGVEEDPANAGYPNIYADLSEATAAAVTTIRRAFALQRFAEARARFGSRYSEYLAYLGVRSPDARLQRPEYLGGASIPVSISEILQTAPDDQVDPDQGVGDLYGHGIAVGRSHAYRRMFREHGYVMSLLSVRPRAVYASGVERTFLRLDREDYWQKELEHIGQQQILQQEVHAEVSTEDDVFGYGDRYAEYRRQESKVTGEFRSTFDYWHLGRIFTSTPALNSTFVSCDPGKRIFNDQTNHSLWCAVQHRLVARRLVSKRASGRIL